MQKKNTNKQKTDIRQHKQTVKERSRNYWRFLRNHTKERTPLLRAFHSLCSYTNQEHVSIIIQLLNREEASQQKTLLASFVDALNHIPTGQHHRFFSLLDTLAPFVPIAEILPLASPLFFRFDEDQLARFVSFCCSYSEPELIVRALRLENLQAQQFAAKETGEDIFLNMVGSLTLYAQAHCNRPVQIEVGETSFTDGIHIYLPARLEHPVPEQEYRIRTALIVGYLEFGTLDVQLQEIEGKWVHPKPTEIEIERMFRSFSNPVLAKEIFLLFEDYRIHTHMVAKYPGMAILLSERRKKEALIPRDSSVVEQFICELANWLTCQEPPLVHASMIRRLNIDALSNASVLESIKLLQQSYDYAYGLLQKSISYQPQQRVLSTLQTNKMRQADRLHQIEVERSREKKERQSNIFDFQEASEFMDRMQGPAGPQKEKQEKEETFHPNVRKGAQPLDGEWCYPEWDYVLQDEKPSFTRVLMLKPIERYCDFVETTKRQYASDIDKIRRVFSSLRPQNLEWERNLSSGMMLNIDQMIQDQIDMRQGAVDTKPYMNTLKKERSVSVAFLIDLSSSTNELVGVSGKRIIDIQKEALVLISEALHAVGDFFSIYGFSGYGRDQVAIYTVKEEKESWNTTVQNRLGNLSWKMENRDGAAIRHVTTLLRKGEGKKKILFLLSDGKPLDCGCSLYNDTYAQEDTRAALTEAKKSGIHPFCITVDEAGADYLPRMYGKSFVVINNLKALPIQLPILYRRYIQ